MPTPTAQTLRSRENARGDMKAKLTQAERHVLGCLEYGNRRHRDINGATVQALNRLVKKGYAVRFIGAFKEYEWTLKTKINPAPTTRLG